MPALGDTDREAFDAKHKMTTDRGAEPTVSGSGVTDTTRYMAGSARRALSPIFRSGPTIWAGTSSAVWW